jgi:formylglycine-generating enzyme required for sulfatase activity
MLQLAGGKVTLGTNDKNFKESERPAMEVVLDYEFYMGIHEITCGDYASVAKKAKLKTFGKCENDSLPLTDITYYDVILFANAKSKLEKRDTVYTYRRAVFDEEKHCTNLEGFAFHADIEGYRLPTEAEWIYAATRAWDIKKSWNNSNSEYKLHPVCSKDTDSAGLCDMAGNALEWVNDWMGKFRDTTITNYVGAPDGGDMGERVVKGGSYNSSSVEVNPYSRGDVYTVTSPTLAEYVGFRLALGKIPNALWMSNDGHSTASIVTPTANSETVKNFTRTYNA